MSTYRVLSILPRTKQHSIGGHAAGSLPDTAGWDRSQRGKISGSQSCMGNIVRLYHIIYHSYKLMSSTNPMSSTHHVPSTHHISPAHQDPSRAQGRIVCLPYSCWRELPPRIPQTKHHRNECYGYRCFWIDVSGST